MCVGACKLIGWRGLPTEEVKIAKGRHESAVRERQAAALREQREEMVRKSLQCESEQKDGQQSTPIVRQLLSFDAES